MKVTLEQIEKAESAFVRMNSLPLPGRLAYQVSKLVRLLRPEMEAFGLAKQGLIDRLGVEDGAHPGLYVAKEGCREEWDQELAELRATEIDLGEWPLDEAILDRVNLTPVEVELLEPFIAWK